MKKIDELRQSLTAKETEVRNFLNENKVTEAETSMEEVRNLKKAIKLQEELDAEEREQINDNIEVIENNKNEEERGKKDMNIEQRDAMQVRAYIKAMTGKGLNAEERALVVGGASGEGYILPQTISTRIQTLLRSYRSLREAVGYMPSTTLSGSFPIENFETVSELVDFADDGSTDLTEATDIKFKNVSYSLKAKGAFIKLSNTLLQMTDNDLINYVAQIFAKKAVVTENKAIIEKLKTGKTAKALADWKALKKSINKDLSEAVKAGTILLTNQDGFDFLDGEDSNGRPLLNDSTANVGGVSVKQFKGYPILVFDNSLLPTVATKVPVFYGNLSEAVKLVDLGQYAFATSEHAGFLSNTTLARVIEFIDVIQVDASDKCYCYGELTVTA